MRGSHSHRGSWLVMHTREAVSDEGQGFPPRPPFFLTSSNTGFVRGRLGQGASDSPDYLLVVCHHRSGTACFADSGLSVLIVQLPRRFPGFRIWAHDKTKRVIFYMQINIQRHPHDSDVARLPLAQILAGTGVTSWPSARVDELAWLPRCFLPGAWLTSGGLSCYWPA